MKLRSPLAWLSSVFRSEQPHSVAARTATAVARLAAIGGVIAADLWGTNQTLIDVADGCRIVCILAAGAIVGWSVVLYARMWTANAHGRDRRRTGAALATLVEAATILAVVALFTEVGKYSHEVTWRLPLNVYAVVRLASAIRRLELWRVPPKDEQR